MGSYVCNADGDGVECDATLAAMPADEECNAADDDCDGLVDEVGVDDPGTAWRDALTMDAFDTVVVNRAGGGTMRMMQYEASRPDASAGDAGPEDAGPRPLAAVLDGPAYAVVGEAVTLDASASTGAVRFAWDLGDGRVREATPEATIEVGWEAAGRYRVVLFAEDEAGERLGMLNVDVTNMTQAAWSLSGRSA